LTEEIFAAAIPLLSRFFIFGPFWQSVSATGLCFLGFNIHDMAGHRAWLVFNDLSLVSLGALMALSSLVRLRSSRET
jgi:hypothetical protein